MKRVYWGVYMKESCFWWQCSTVPPSFLCSVEVKHTADGSKTAADSQIKHIQNQDKYWPGHRFKKEMRRGKGSVEETFFRSRLISNRDLVRYSDHVEFVERSGTRRGGRRDAEAHFKADKAALCRPVRSISDPSVAVNLAVCLWRERTRSPFMLVRRRQSLSDGRVFPQQVGVSRKWSWNSFILS